MRNSTSIALYAVLGVLIVIAGVRLWIHWQHHVESPQELLDLALRPGNPDDQERAAAKLEALAGKSRGTESRNPVQPFLVRLLNESDNPGARAAAMRGLATIWDYQCMPKMLDLMQDPAPRVRQAAAQAATKLIEFDVHFDSNASVEQRAEAVKRLRAAWENFEVRTLKSWQRRMEEKDLKP